MDTSEGGIAPLRLVLRQDLEELFEQNLGRIEDRFRDLLQRQKVELLASVRPLVAASSSRAAASNVSIDEAFSEIDLVCNERDPVIFVPLEKNVEQQDDTSQDQEMPLDICPAKQEVAFTKEDFANSHNVGQFSVGSKGNGDQIDGAGMRPSLIHCNSELAANGGGVDAFQSRRNTVGLIRARRLKSYASVNLTRTIGRSLDVDEDHPFASVLSWWDELRDTSKGEGRLAKFVDSAMFSFFCTFVIVVHAVISTLDVNTELRRAADGHEYDSEAYVTLKISIVVWYIVELAFRIGAHRLHFFLGEDWTWNVFDFVLVCLTIIDAFLVMALDLPIIRPLRMLKVVRVLRTIRMARFFTDLRLMVVCILNSLHTLFWCILLLFFIQYIFSMLLVQGVTVHFLDEMDRIEDSEVKRMMDSFGSVGQSSLTLWMAVTGGQDWKEYYDVILVTGESNAVIFVFYIAFFVIAAFNIVTGTFVNKAFTIARPDPEMLIRAKEVQDQDYAARLADLFNHADDNGSGLLSRAEFMQVFEEERHALLEVIGVSNVDSESLFDLLTVAGEKLDVMSFVTGLLMLSGPARSIDIHLSEHRIMSRLETLCRQFSTLHKTIELS